MSQGRKKAFGQGRSPTRFSFTYEDVADAAGCSTGAARKHAQRGNFNPNDLVSILEFIQERLHKSGDSLSELANEGREALKG